MGIRKEDKMRPTQLRISLSNLTYNIKSIKQKLNIGTGIIAVVKAGGYGTGVERLLEVFKKEGINNFAVALAQEGAKLREKDSKINILILNQPYCDEIEMIVENNLICGACDINFIKELNAKSYKKNIVSKINLEIDTGAGRNGILPENIHVFLNEINSLKNVDVEGAFMHFTCADSDIEYSEMQMEKFNRAISELIKHTKIKYVHAASSSALLNFPQAHYDFVRPGILLYGYYPDESQRVKIDLKPVEKLVSKITFLKILPANSGISYDKTFITKKESIIAVVPVGYADGYRRAFSNKAKVVINGQKANVVGKVCMDMIMVDVTKVKDAKVGDEVCLFDNDMITVDELADIAQTINYEIISGITERVPRIYEP